VIDFHAKAETQKIAACSLRIDFQTIFLITVKVRDIKDDATSLSQARVSEKINSAFIAGMWLVGK